MPAIFNVTGDVATTVLGAVLVAVFTAWLTARTTNNRLDKQLAAERDRLNRQLAHERIEADRAELRKALDTAASAAIDAFRKAGTASAAMRPEHYDAQTPAGLEEQLAFGRKKARLATRAVSDLTPHKAQLQLRLSASHLTVGHFSRLTDLGNDFSALIPREFPASPEEADRCLEATRDYMAAMEEFIESAHTVVGTSAPALEPPVEEAK